MKTRTNKTTEDFTPVLLGGDANVYGMARSFFEGYGKKSHCIGKGSFHICQHSRYLSLDIVEPDLEDDDVFVDTLLAFAKAHDGENLVLVPCGDNYANLLVRNQDELRDAYLFSCPSKELFRQLETKSQFYKLCEWYGLAFPKTYEVTKYEHGLFEPDFDYPVVVKPANSVAYWQCCYTGKKKAFIVRDSYELHTIFQLVYQSGYSESMLVQEYIPGDDNCMRVVNCYSNKEGHVTLASVGEVLLEEHTPEGIGSYSAIITGDDKQILKAIKGFLEEIGYVGFSNFDLKKDARDGIWKILELNPRQGRSSYSVTASGCNLAKYFVNDVVLGRDDACDTPVTDNAVLWTMVPIDLIFSYVKNSRARIRAKRLLDRGRVVHSYWTRSDSSPLRWISYKMNQRNYRQQYERYFNKRHLWD